MTPALLRPTLAPPSPLAAVVGAVRVAAILAVVAAGSAAVLAAACLPRRAGGAAAAEHVAVGLCRACLWIAGVERRVEGGGALRRHRGFVFFNHVSFLDPLVLVAVAPLRFLATAGVRRLPFLGPMATALGTVYVHRGQHESRAAARTELAEAVGTSPVPVAVAPEGRIGPGGRVLPFRHGAFEVAADARAPVLLVALSFEPHAPVVWGDGEWVLAALWRLCARTGPLVARLTAIPPARTVPPGAAPRAARDAEDRVRGVLRRDREAASGGLESGCAEETSR